MTKSTDQETFGIGQEKVLGLVSAIIGGRAGRPDDDHPLPPGPWDPVVRLALERVTVFGPRPEPWKLVLANILRRHPEAWDVIGGPGLGGEVALNPQPLPPRYSFLLAVAQTVADRVGLLQELAGAVTGEQQQQGIIIVGGHISRFLDDICGTGFRLRYPFPGPRPNWFTAELTGIDLVVLATGFAQAAAESFGSELRRQLSDAAARLVREGFSRL